MRKHILNFVFILCLVLGIVPATAFAGETGYVAMEGTEGNSGEEYTNLVDGDINSKWCVTSFSKAYVIFKAPKSTSVSGYSITTGNDNKDNPGRNPKSWTLYGCNEYSETSSQWDIIHSVKNDTVLQDVNNTTYDFIFEKTAKSYQYFKLEISAIQSGDVMQMSEFALTDCDHKWNDPETTPSTCSTSGYTRTQCNTCKHTMIERIAPLGHDFSDEGGKCSRCHKTRSQLYTFDISKGKIEIRDDEEYAGKIKVCYVKGEAAGTSEGYIDPDETITVTGNTSQYELHVLAQTPVKIKASNLSIDSSANQYAYAFLVTGGNNIGNATLILEGKNIFKGGAQKAGITVGEGRKLTMEGDGYLEAYGGSGAAGIGGEKNRSAGEIIVKDDIVITANGGDGGAGIGVSRGYDSTFAIGKDSNPTIFASSISDQSGKEKGEWHGLIFESTNGKIYGTNYILSKKITIPSDKTLEIEEGQFLVISKDATLMNKGTIENNGKMLVEGTFLGMADNLYYPLTVKNATVQGDLFKYNEKIYAKAGSKITLKYTAPTGYKFSNWTSNDVNIINFGFIMPTTNVTVTANWEKNPEIINPPAQSTTVLRLQATASDKLIKMKWNKIPGADGYVICWNKCIAKNDLKQIKEVNGKTLSWTHKKLKKNSQNRYIVKAYKMIGGRKFFIRTSNQIHLVTKGGKYTNVKKLKSSVSSVTLKKGKTKALKIRQTYAQKNKKLVKHMKSLTYTTSDKKVATVTSKGVIKAKGKGNCYIYITANSGVYTRVKVRVK